MITNYNYCLPATVFLTFGLVAGLSFIVIVPPFQVPDEFHHFWRAYQISEGKFIADRTNGRVGGYLPAGLRDVGYPFSNLRWNPYSKTSWKIIKDAFSVPLQPDNRIFYDFPQEALYSPVCYLPQSSGIYLLNKLDCSPLAMMYGGRLSALFFWLTIAYCSILIIPVHKWGFAFLSLLPLSVFQNMSLSADVVTNSIAFCLVALSLRMATGDVTKKHLAGFFIISVLLCLVKTAYIPLILLFFVIPAKKVGSRYRYMIIIYSLVAVCGIAAGAWGYVVKDMFVSFNDYHPAFRDNVPVMRNTGPQEQLAFILQNPLFFLNLFFERVISVFSYHGALGAYIGLLGWGEISLPHWLKILLLTGALFLGFSERFFTTFSLWQKAIIAVSVFSVISLVLLSEYLIWTPVGENAIYGITGRYFIPVFPLVIVMLNWKKTIAEKFQKYYHGLFCAVVCLSLVFTSFSLYGRYFSPNTMIEEISCNAEQRSDDGTSFIGSHTEKKLANGNTRSAEKSHSGAFSAKLTQEEPYSMTCELTNVKKGEQFQVFVWKWDSSETGLIVSASSENSFYKTNYTVTEADSNGWQHLMQCYEVPIDLPDDKLKIYLWNTGKQDVFFDDLHILRGK